MDIHKPKPAHSVREFLIELGTIICGILIALGLEQLVSTIEWGRKVTETREALGLEVADNLGKLANRVKLGHCTDQRLDALAVIVDNASKTGLLPALPTPHQPVNYSWSTGVWSSALSAQSASHLPPAQLRGYGRVYQIIDRISDLEPKEESAWTTLYELAGPGRPFDADDARTYRRAISQARELNGLIRGFGVRATQAVDGYHISYDANVFSEKTTRIAKTAPQCGPPTGTPPAQYGAAPDANFADIASRYPTK